jgi:glycosyltransferase involved in cell wall biosynthesis
MNEQAVWPRYGAALHRTARRSLSLCVASVESEDHVSKDHAISRLPALPTIAFISEHDDPLAAPGGVGKGGQNVYVQEVAQRLAAHGWGVDVFTRRESLDLPAIQAFGPAARVIRIPAGPATYVPKEELVQYMPEFLSNLLAGYATHTPYQLVHGHYYLSGVLASALQRRLGIPFVQTFHSLGKLKRQALGTRDGSPPVRLDLERQVAADATCIIATSPQECDDLINLYGAQPQKIKIVPCGVDLQRFQPTDPARARQELGLPAEPFLITFVGRIEPQKGIEVLLEAAARLRGLAPSLHFHVVIVGGTPRQRLARGWGSTDDRYTLELEALAHTLGLTEHVTWTGGLPHEALATTYSAADVMVIPSHYESFGMTALEALACGACVVASRTGGLRTTLDEGRAGVLFTPGAPDELAAQLARLAANPLLRGSFQQDARSYVTRTYGWDQVTAQLAAIYRELNDTHNLTLFEQRAPLERLELVTSV